MKKIILIITLIAGFSAAAQTSNVRVRSNIHFNKSETITVETAAFSPELTGQLEDALWDAGFKVISERSARQFVRLEQVGSSFESNTKTLSEGSEINSVYIITANGREANVRKGVDAAAVGLAIATGGLSSIFHHPEGKGLKVRRIAFNIIDLKSGEIVAKINYDGKKIQASQLFKLIVQRL